MGYAQASIEQVTAENAIDYGDRDPVKVMWDAAAATKTWQNTPALFLAATR